MEVFQMSPVRAEGSWENALDGNGEIKGTLTSSASVSDGSKVTVTDTKTITEHMADDTIMDGYSVDETHSHSIARETSKVLN